MEQLWRQLEGQTVEQKYVLEKLLGAGGFGGVFLAAHVVGEHVLRKVAVKLMPAGNTGEELSELLGATSIRHPHLLFCQDAGQTVVGSLRVLYLVTELADETLADQLRKAPLRPAEIQTLARQLSSALAYLHGQGRVHRDVKPANVLRVGEDWKLSDFGLLRAIDKEHTHRTQNIIGTERYLPPEAFDGIVSPAWDMWAFGVTLAEALTGKAWAVTDEVTRRTAPDARQPSRPELPPPFDAIVSGCTREDRKARMTAGEVLKVLSGGQASEPAAWEDAPTRRTAVPGPLSAAARTWSFPKWSRNTWMAVGGGLLLILLFLFWPRGGTSPAIATNAAPAGVTTGNDQAAIGTLINDWAGTTRSRRIDQQLVLYAPILERFFHERNVPREVVRAKKEAVLARYPNLNEFRVERVVIDSLTPAQAVVSLDKVWDMQGQGRFAGAARERLVLRRTDGAWRIVSEEDIEVYRVVAEP